MDRVGVVVVDRCRERWKCRQNQFKRADENRRRALGRAIQGGDVGHSGRVDPKARSRQGYRLPRVFQDVVRLGTKSASDLGVCV